MRSMTTTSLIYNKFIDVKDKKSIYTLLTTSEHLEINDK
jgi:hypothetical protein